MEPITKEALLKTDPDLKNRPYQIEAIQSILPQQKCLAKMFCGTGKSRIITNVIIHEKKDLSVVVFPSLALIRQYSDDYLNNDEDKKHFKKYFKKHQIINVSSDKLSEIKSTTDPKEIRKVLKGKGPKIVLVTYQSLDVFLSCLDGQKIGVICYDEAHHVTSPEYQKLVFGTDYYEKEVFFTATPRNENGITMYDRDDPEKNMCGPVAYEYTYLQGLNDKVLNAFEICVDMYTENTNRSIYEAMARAILTKGTSRALSFHSGVNGESNTDVKKFVNEEEFRTVFQQILMAEFREKELYYKKITFKGMDGTTPTDDREIMLKELYATPNNEIYIIASCETIGEGVDTKKANMCLFADPKSSIIKIIQNIGRVLRRNEDCPTSTILIPCWIDKEKYQACQGDKIKQDEIIREQMRAGDKGDFACILNVLAALKQEDLELYDACLNYPIREHKEASLNEQGFHIADEEDEDSDASETDTVVYDEEEVQQMKEEGEIPLEIHTNETIERFNEEVEEEPLMRLYHDEEEGVYREILPNEEDEEDEEDERRIITPPPKKKVSMNFHMSSDVQMLWSITPGDLDKNIRSAIIECEVIKVDQMEIAIGIVTFIKKEGRNPNQYRSIINRTKEEEIEHFYANKLRWWKQCINGSCDGICRNDIRDYLDIEIPGWRDKRNLEEDALNYAKEIVTYVKEHNNGILPKRCDKKNIIDKRSEKQIKENVYAIRLGEWRRDLKEHKPGSIRCYDKVSEYLDSELPNWREEINLEEQAINKAKEIVTWIKTINDGNLPKMYGCISDLKKRKIILTEPQKIENNFGRKLSLWRMALNTDLNKIKKRKKTSDKDYVKKRKRNGVHARCYDNVRDYLDKEIPEWRRDDVELKLLEKAKEFVLYIKNKLHGKLPQTIKYPENEDEENEREWGLVLTAWKSRVNPKVLILLNKEIPGWNDTLDDKAMDYAKKIVEYIRNTLHGSLPKHFKNTVLENETIEQREREGIYANKLRSWKNALDGSENSMCSDEVRDYLDKEIPGWRDDKIIKQNMDKAREIVNFVKTVLKGKLPQQYQKKMKNGIDTRSKQQLQEHTYAQSLSSIKKKLKKKGNIIASDSNIAYLDKELPGWRPIIEETIKTQQLTKEHIPTRKNKQTPNPIATTSQPVAIPVAQPITPPKKMKRKLVLIEDSPKPNKSYSDLSEAEKQKICEKELKKRQEKKGYRTTNPDDKDTINNVFAKNINITTSGKIVFLDHTEFKTAYSLFEYGVKPEDMLIPQRPDNYTEMSQHELFGSSVVQGEFNEVLSQYMTNGGMVKGVYADYCSTLEKDGLPFIELLSKYKSSISADAVIGVTITLRNPEPVRYAGQDILILDKKIDRTFQNGENLFCKEGIIPDDGPYTYGNGAPMATWIFRV